jgi:hypothetical protein
MRYFVPDLRLPGELPKQDSFEEKLGGLPWGIPAEKWPKCRECGKSQSLLAQFLHHPIRLNLGRTGRVLSIFQCNHDPGMCSTWQGDSGANACFVTDEENLVRSLTRVPPDTPMIEQEARIVDWIERDDGFTEEQARCFFALESFNKLPQEIIQKVSMSTKLGGVPAWIQSPDEGPKEGWRFVGQLDSLYSFQTAPKVAASDVSPDKERWEGRSHYCKGPNFGDGGIAYLFLKDSQDLPEGWFFWQCG